jgi:hypothetical protein
MRRDFQNGVRMTLDFSRANESLNGIPLGTCTTAINARSSVQIVISAYIRMSRLIERHSHADCALLIYDLHVRTHNI